MESFKNQVETRGGEPFLGTRLKTGEDDKGGPLFGEYVW
jgi:hypothetical protein